MALTIKITRTGNVVQRLTADQKAVGKIVARATNKALPKVRQVANRRTARQLRLPLRFIRKRFRLSGAAGKDRSVIRKARAGSLKGYIEVYMRGIPVFQIAGKQPKKRRPFVKARGGRTYHGAFYGYSGKAGRTLVFKPRSTTGPRGGRLGVPKVAVRERLRRNIRSIMKTVGRKTWRREFDRLLNAKFSQ